MPRSPWLGVYNTGSGLPALMDSHPAWFSPGRPHCVILWLDGSARCPLPLTAQAGAARLLGDVPRWLLVKGCRMRTLTCSVFKGRRESERSAAHSFSANSAALFRGRLIYPFIFIGIGKAVFTPPFSEVFEVCASVYKPTSVICAISRQFPPVSNQCKPVGPLCGLGR